MRLKDRENLAGSRLLRTSAAISGNASMAGNPFQTPRSAKWPTLIMHGIDSACWSVDALLAPLPVVVSFKFLLEAEFRAFPAVAGHITRIVTTLLGPYWVLGKSRLLVVISPLSYLSLIRC